MHHLGRRHRTEPAALEGLQVTRLPAEVFKVPLDDLALELGLHLSGVYRRVIVLGMETRRRITHQATSKHRRLCVTVEDGERLRADYRSRVAVGRQIEHWLTSQQAADALGLTLAGFLQRVQAGTLTIERRMMAGMPGQAMRYNPQDVRREAVRLGIRPRSVPKGAWTSRDLQQTMGISRDVLRRWRERGCPQHKLVNGHAYWWPAEVETWMLSQRQQVAS